MKVYFSKGGTPFTVVMDIVAPDLRNFLKADRTGTRRGLCEAVEKMFKNKGVQARFEDECHECGHVMTPSASGASLYCRNVNCKEAMPTQDEMSRLMVENRYKDGETAKDYFVRLVAKWRNENAAKAYEQTQKQTPKRRMK